LVKGLANNWYTEDTLILTHIELSALGVVNALELETIVAKRRTLSFLTLAFAPFFILQPEP